METKFGPVAKDGDYVLVVDFNYMRRKCETYIAKVHKGKAYTGMKNFPHDTHYIHKQKALVVVPESYVDDDIKERIKHDIETEVM